MDTKGIFTKEQEQKIAGILDDVAKLKGFLELVDGYAFKIVIAFVDDEFAERIPEQYKDKLRALATALLNEDFDLAETLASEAINELVDLPLLDEETEGVIFKGAIEFVVGLVQKWIAKKKAATDTPV